MGKIYTIVCQKCHMDSASGPDKADVKAAAARHQAKKHPAPPEEQK